jgi:HTH-type transcriptional regulator, competence development regulator
MGAKKSFGQTIRDLRKAKKPPLTQRELAERVAARLREEDLRGFDFTYLSKIENDRLPPPSAAAIIALAEELDANADELLALAEKAPADLGEAMKKSEGARTFFRSAVNENLSEEEWNRLLDTLKRMKKGRGE